MGVAPEKLLGLFPQFIRAPLNFVRGSCSFKGVRVNHGKRLSRIDPGERASIIQFKICLWVFLLPTFDNVNNFTIGRLCMLAEEWTVEHSSIAISMSLIYIR